MARKPANRSGSAFRRVRPRADEPAEESGEFSIFGGDDPAEQPAAPPPGAVGSQGDTQVGMRAIRPEELASTRDDEGTDTATSVAEWRTQAAGADEDSSMGTVPSVSAADLEALEARAVPMPAPDRPSAAPRPFFRPRKPHLRRIEMRRKSVPAEARYGFFSIFFGFIGLIIRVVVVTVIVLGIAAVVGFEAVRMYVQTPTVTVPNVSGMRVPEALALLSKSQLALFEERVEPNSMSPPGEILSQRPAAGVATKSASVVRVTIAGGRASFVVPNVVGETREIAINRIAGAGFQVGNVTTLESDSVAQDSVISQTPEGGRGFETAERVDLLVSAGPRGSSLLMPDLTGRTLEEAQAALRRLGIGTVFIQPEGAAGGRVVEQTPLVGKQIRRTEEITLRVE